MSNETPTPRLHSMACNFPEGCTCGATDYNNLCDRLAAAQAALAKSKEKYAGLYSDCESRLSELQQSLAQSEARVKELEVCFAYWHNLCGTKVSELTTAQGERDSALSDLAESRARCAAMREVLELALPYVVDHVDGAPDANAKAKEANFLVGDINQALSTTSGTELLEELKGLREDKERLDYMQSHMAATMLAVLRQRSDLPKGTMRDHIDHIRKGAQS